MLKVKVIRALEFSMIEKNINQALKELDDNAFIRDVKFTSTTVYDPDSLTSNNIYDEHIAIILYNQPD